MELRRRCANELGSSTPKILRSAGPAALTSLRRTGPHLRKDNRTTVRVGQHDEAAPGRILRRPEDGQTPLDGFPFASVGILDSEPHRCTADSYSRREDPTLVVASVVAVQDNSARGPSDDHDDFVFEEERDAERTHVEGPCLRQVGNEEDEAFKANGPHEGDATGAGAYSML